MIKGMMCETCGEFNEGTSEWSSVTECPVCGQDMCNSCANDFLCPACFKRWEKGELTEVKPEYEYEDGEWVLIGWIKRTERG